MNTLYLHVGPHKTGTTSLQKFLLDNREKLFRSNLVYPKQYLAIFGHHEFRQRIVNRSLTEEDIRFFAEPHDYLLSSEDFISLNKEDFEYLRNQITSKKIVVLFTWRRASFKLYSIWQETIKHGGVDSFYTYYHDHLARPGQSQMLSADLKLAMFCHVFGKRHVKVLDYDASSIKGSLFQDFCSMLNISWDPSFTTPEKNPDAVNKSMDIEDIEVIRALNCMLLRNSDISGDKVRHLYIKNHNLLLQLGLEELKSTMQDYEHFLKVGNYFIDNRCEKIMVDKFADNMTNYQVNTQIKSVRLIRPEWMVEFKAHKILNNMKDAFEGLMSA